VVARPTAASATRGRPRTQHCGSWGFPTLKTFGYYSLRSMF
jgi:hypothetical protein